MYAVNGKCNKFQLHNLIMPSK